MKKKVIIGIIASMILLAVTTRVKAQSYDKLWKDIASFEKKDMPKSIIECCNAIIKKAQSENNTGQLLKAYIYRMQCKESISEDSLYTSVKDLENRVLTTKSPVDNMVIHSILAGIYAGYASMNDYELDERTNASGVKDADDMREWTHIQFNSAILRHVEASLSDISLLHATSTKKYLPFTSQNWASEYYKHDMLHLIARKAINSLNALSNSEVKRQKTDSIYQLMQNIYRSDKQEEAYVLVTLDKLNFQKSVSKINDKTYTASLNNLLNDVDKSKEIRSEIFLALANDAYSHGKMNKTLDLCNQAISLYPKYNRITSLQELRNRILNPSVSLSIINAAYPLSKEKIFVNHKNANGFTLRIYRIPDALITKDNIKAEDCKLLNEQHFNLTQPKNYIEKKDSFMITTPDVGVYLIETKVDGAAKNSNTQNAILHISRLMLLSMSNKGQHQFVVTDRTSGQLIEGATVIAYDHKNRVLQQGTTDNKGKVTMTVSSNSNQVKAVKGNDKYMDKQYLSNSYYYSSNDSTTQHILKLLTDRSIYRPGQIVHVKGIAYSQRGDNAKTIDSKSYQLSLRDANHQEIANKKVTTNGFGSFTVDFTLPSSCLNGNFSVTSQTDGSYAYFRVEEYKRPTFEVTTDDVKESYSLGDTVYIKGKAKTFSGVPVDGAMAKYTVKRSEWCWWRENGDEITTNDSVKLAPDGSFTIPVYLSKKNQTESDEEDEEKDEEDDVFTYYTFNTEIHVTTPAGETQNGNVTLAAGQRSLILSLSEKETICKDKPIKLTFEAKNLLQKPVDTNIDYSLVALKNGKETDVVDKGTVSANKEISLAQWQQLPSGRYIVHLTAKDSQNRTVDRKTNIILFSKNDVHPVENCNIWYYSDDENFDGQHPAKFYFGTSRKDATVLMDVFSNGTCIDSKILTLSDEIKSFEYPYKESYGNGLSINFCFVKDGTLYQKIITLKKSLPNNELKIKWSVFRDKLRPGQKEEWRLNILSPSNKPANAEMLALMYDASLNKIWERRNQQNLSLSYNRYIPEISWNSSYIERMRLWYNASLPNLIIKPFSFDNYLDNTYDSSRPFGRVFGVMGNDEVTDAALDESPVVVAYGVSKQRVMAESKSVRGQTSKIMVRGLAAPKLYANASIDMNQNDNANTVRTNFAETAFFYPQLRTDEKGNISIAFTLPESLTKWQFEGYAHTKDMMTGYLSGETVASKDFMLTPNLPRFVRVGDQTSVAATVSNMTEKQIQANVKFELFDPTTEQVIMTQNKPVSLGEKKSEAVTFSFLVTDRYDILGVRMIADGGTFSDGEQHILPVLSDQVMLTESVPLPIRGNQTREFSLEKLFNRHSKTATNRKLTVEYTGNPAWYAVQALPSLAMPTNDNAISWASVLYANTLASYIANSTPRIKAVIDSWKLNGGTKETLLSNLQKNQELKNILLEESPWVLEAKSEQEQKERLGTLFDLNSLQNNSLAAINKLKLLQDEDGAWSWYKGMPGSRFITEYIVRLNARLQMLTKALPSKEVSEMQSKAINFLHQESQKEYEFILKAEKEGQKIHGISYPALRYLYLIAITGEKIPSIYSKEYNYFLSKVNEEPASQDMQEKSLAAIILDKAGMKSAAKDYIASIKEHLTKSDELGMYFDFTDNPFSWLGMHLSAHTAAIEAIDKVADDNTTVEEMKLWLLKQKQTQMWDTPVSTTDAIYALLERGTDILASSGNVSLSFANRTMQTSQKGSAGLGYIKQTFTDNTSTDAHSIIVAKKDNGIAWGAVYAQFQDKIANVKQEGSQSFNVKKDMFVKRIINNTAELQPIRENSTLKVGDIVVARLIIQLDRKMDFVQLKEQRGACFEPITNLSGYRWGAGTGYYEEIKDASTNFFFDSLEKGSYVLEINYRVSRTGDYEVGLSSLQCAYAPEFVTHSHSMRIKVEE